jgi:hypothetical protein
MFRTLLKFGCIALLSVACIIGFNTTGARAAVVITGTVGAKAYLITGSTINTKAHSNVKITFVDNTGGTNVALCSGTSAQVASNTCGTQLNDSGGPGFIFLTLIDVATLNGLQLYAIREAGSTPASFTLTIE